MEKNEATPTPPAREIPSEDFKVALAQIGEFAKSCATTAERNEKALQIYADIEKARATNKVVSMASERPPMTMSAREIIEADPTELSTDFERDLQETARTTRAVHQVMSFGAARGRCNYRGPKDLKVGRKLEKLLTFASAWDTRTDGDGGGSIGSQDWINTQYLSTVIDVKTIEPRVASLFEIVRSKVPVRVPVISTEQTVSIISESTASTDGAALYVATTSPDTDFVQIDSRTKHRAGTVMSTEFVEASVIPAVAQAEATIRKYLRLALDTCCLNGQLVNQATLDTANGPASANAYIGATVGTTNNSLRNYAHVTNLNQVDAAGAALDSGMVAQARKKMGVFGGDPSELAFIPNIVAYLDLVADPDNNVTTVEKYGPGATILTGELGRIWGIPIVPTDRIAVNLGADGDATATSNLTGAILVNRTRWVVGINRDIDIRLVPNPVSDQIAVYGFMLTAFVPAGVSTSEKHTAYIIGLPTT